MSTISGYRFDETLPPSPVSAADLDLLLQTLMWSEDDTAALRRAGEVLSDQVEAILDLWYGYVGSNPHLVQFFNETDGTPSTAYLEAVRHRFGQWIHDLCDRPWDQSWLAYQHEIAQRHVTTMGQTDGVQTAHAHVSLRYMIAFVWPITATIRDFLAAKGNSADEVDAMHTAWFKAVTLTVALWAQPYAPQTW